MQEDRTRIEDVERSMEATRGRMAATVAELDEKVSARIAAAKETVDIGRLVAEHPWPALVLALGAGFVLARSGADSRAAHAAADAAREAPAAAKRGARKAARAVRERFAGGDDASADVAADVEHPSEEPSRPQEIALRVSRALHGDELLDDMRGEADRIGRAAPDRPDVDPRRI
ncbi:MAG TPA: hypothetical protein VFZ11_14370 [Gemmatimonadaceae bacterium]